MTGGEGDDGMITESDKSAARMFLKSKALRRGLSYREREMMKLRYGLGDGYSYTLEEVGHIFKCSRERVRGVERKFFERVAVYLKSDSVYQTAGYDPIAMGA